MLEVFSTVTEQDGQRQAVCPGPTNVFDILPPMLISSQKTSTEDLGPPDICLFQVSSSVLLHCCLALAVLQSHQGKCWKYPCYPNTMK